MSETASGTTTDLYYSDRWQVVEERVGGQARAQYVWSPVFVDALVLRDRDTNADGTLEERLYAQQDANYNVTALVGQVSNSWVVVERYAYDPFGKVTVYDANYVVRPSGSAYVQTVLFQGFRQDLVTGFYHARIREYSPSLGRPVQADPIRFAAGDANFYRWEGNSPPTLLDPLGLYTSMAGQKDCKGVSVDVVAALPNDDVIEMAARYQAVAKNDIKLQINGFDDMIKKITDAILAKQIARGTRDKCPCVCISRLVIRTHGGGSPGAVELSRSMDPTIIKNMGAWEVDSSNPNYNSALGARVAAGLRKLKSLLCREGKVVLWVCNVGKDQSYLDALARQLGVPVFGPTASTRQGIVNGIHEGCMLICPGGYFFGGGFALDAIDGLEYGEWKWKEGKP